MKKQLIPFFMVFSLLGLCPDLSEAQVLNDSVIRLPAVEITDSAFTLQNNRSLIGKLQLEQSPSADIAEILGKQPNIGGIRRGGYAVDPVIRGFRYSQINIFLDDGVHIEGGCPNRMDPVLSHLESEDIERIEIVRGPYQLKYGPSPAASVRVITTGDIPYNIKKPGIRSFSGYDANRNGFRQHISVSGSGKQIYYKVAGGLKDYGNYIDGNGKEWNSAYAGKNVAATLGVKINAIEELLFSYKGSFSREVMFPSLPMDEIADNTNIYTFNYKRKHPARFGDQLMISGFHSMVYHEMDNRFRPQYSMVVEPYTGLMQASAIVKTRVSGLRMDIRKITGNIRLNYGIDGQYSFKDGTRHTTMIMQMDDQQYISEKWTNLWKDAAILNSGLYAGFDANRRKTSYNAVIRFDVNHSHSGDTLVIRNEEATWFDAKPETKVLWSMATMVSHKVSEYFSVSLGLARSARPPDMQERYIKFLATGYDKYDYLGNPGLDAEINHQADLILKYTRNRSEIVLNFFRSDVQNYIYGILLPPSVARPVSMGAPGVKQFNNIDRAVLMGFESTFTTNITENFNLALSAGYTFAYFPEIQKILLENGQYNGTVMLKNDPIAEIPAMEGLMKISYSFPQIRLQPAVEIRAVADQHQNSEASYESSTPGYAIASILVNYKPFRYISLTAGINNITDKGYYDHLNRKQAGTTGKLYEPGRTLFINLIITL
ncbi:MAG: TonB-dependent receptor [Bacteroidales bacterium]|nr:TonB-dependent receptor [Bacteroidales bacterium]